MMTAETFWIVFPLWLNAFLLTLVVEVPLFFGIAKLDKQLARRCPTWRLVLAGAAGTCLTHPLLWFIWPLVVGKDYTTYIVSGELLIFIVEIFTFMFIAQPIRFRYALAASFFANAASWTAGILVRLIW